MTGCDRQASRQPAAPPGPNRASPAAGLIEASSRSIGGLRGVPRRRNGAAPPGVVRSANTGVAASLRLPRTPWLSSGRQPAYRRPAWLRSAVASVRGCGPEDGLGFDTALRAYSPRGRVDDQGPGLRVE